MCYMRKRDRAHNRRAQTADATANDRVGVRELRQNLSVYLERVKRGEALTVTEHGHDVALLRPLPPATDVIERLAAEGRVTRPTRLLHDLPTPIRIKLKKSVSSILTTMRNDERF